jgi:hypothetical protein
VVLLPEGAEPITAQAPQGAELAGDVERAAVVVAIAGPLEQAHDLHRVGVGLGAHRLPGQLALPAHLALGEGRGPQAAAQEAQAELPALGQHVQAQAQGVAP